MPFLNDPPERQDDADLALIEALDQTFLGDYNYSRDPASRPLPEKEIREFPRIDPELDEISQACKGQVPVWSTPVPVIKQVKCQEHLTKALDYLRDKELIAINVFGRRIDRTSDPAYIVISCQPVDKIVSIVFRFCRPTVEKLQEIIFSETSIKLVTGLDWLSDLFFHRLYPGQVWDVEKHQIIDLCLLHLDIEKTKFQLESLDVKVTRRSQVPKLASSERLLTAVFPEIDDYSKMDYLHFPIKTKSNLARIEYRLFELGEPYGAAVQNFVMRTCGSYFYIFDKLNMERNSIYAHRVQNSIARTYQTEDDVWKNLSLQRHGNVPSYEPAVVKEERILLFVPEWKSPPFQTIWVDQDNLKQSIEALNCLPSGSRVAINIYGCFVDRFTNPAYMAIGTQTCLSIETTVYVIKCTYREAMDAIFPFLMRTDTYKIVPVVSFIFDVLFKNVYKNKGSIWSAEMHKIIELQSLDSLANKIELLNRNLSIRRGRLTHEDLIAHYLNENISREHFPLYGRDDVHECYVLHLRKKNCGKNLPVIKNYLARTVVTMFFIHPLILKRLNQPMDEQATMAVKMVSNAQNFEEACRRAARLQDLSPTSSLKYSDELMKQEIMDNINDRLFSTTNQA